MPARLFATEVKLYDKFKEPLKMNFNCSLEYLLSLMLEHLCLHHAAMSDFAVSGYGTCSLCEEDHLRKQSSLTLIALCS